MPSNECFYLDGNGRRQDRAIHEAILGEDKLLDPDAVRQRARAHGLSEAMIQRLYGLPPET